MYGSNPGHEMQLEVTTLGGSKRGHERQAVSVRQPFTLRAERNDVFCLPSKSSDAQCTQQSD